MNKIQWIKKERDQITFSRNTNRKTYKRPTVASLLRLMQALNNRNETQGDYYLWVDTDSSQAPWGNHFVCFEYYLTD